MEMLYLYVVAAGLVGTLAAIGIWSNHALWIRAGAVVLVAMFLPLSYVSLLELLGRPKPTGLEWRKSVLTESAVLAFKLREGQGIYLWLEPTGMQEPRAYVLPWSLDVAKQLHGAQRDANERGTGVRMRPPLNGTVEVEGMFYAQPQPPRPPKEIPASAPAVELSRSPRLG